MSSLKQLLDELEIDTGDLEKKDEIDLSTIKIEDLPEEQRPIFKRAMGIIDSQTNKIAGQELVIKTLKETSKIPEKGGEKEEKGLIDENDPYAPMFKELRDEIHSLKSEKVQDVQKIFKNNITSFVKKTPDMVRYVKEMDAILIEHPTMGKDIPTLYKMAKDLKEGRAKAQKEKNDDLDRQGNAGMSTTEMGGTASHLTRQVTAAKSIGEAFDLAEKNLNRR